jgi:hypothetical protein
MPIVRSASAGANRATSRISAEARHWIVPLARFGYAAKGVVHVIVGVIALLSALEAGQRVASSRTALATILEQPHGETLLAIVAVGLLGYAVWRIVQAVKDTEHKGGSAKGLAKRASCAGVGLVYLSLAASAVAMAQGEPSGGGGDQQAVGWTSRLMAQPFGPWLVGAVGLGFIGFGLYEASKGWREKFLRHLRVSEMGETARLVARRSGQVGLIARGAVAAMVGVFLIVAALQSDPSEARGLSGVLLSLERQPFGPWLLGLVALGLTAYGIYMGVEAVYRRIVVD